MKNYPDFAEREAQLVADIAAWEAIAGMEARAFLRCRQRIRQALAAGLSRRHPACYLLFWRMRSHLRLNSEAIRRLSSLNYQLANLRCDEPLPF